MTHPAALDPETAAWMQAQMAISTARAVAPLRAELDKLDDWANGIFVALTDLIPFLLLKHPALARQLQPQWRSAAERFDALQTECNSCSAEGESLELLEARKMLYRIFAVMRLWPEHGQITDRK